MDLSTQPKEDPAAQAVHHELRTVTNSAAYLLPKLLSLKTANPQLTLLDVGAGSGTISISFAQLLPEGFVTATDLNPSILPRASFLAESAGVANISFQQADVYSLPFPDNSFDVTHCHQMLCHLKSPSSALREMLRVTKSGGVVAAREGDLRTQCVWPASPGLSSFHDLVAGLMDLGGSSTAGRELLSWALEVGVRRDQITLSFGTWCYTTSDEKRIWAQGIVETIRAGRMREMALKTGLATEDSFEKMALAWDEWKDQEEASLGMMHGEIIIQK